MATTKKPATDDLVKNLINPDIDIENVSLLHGFVGDGSSDDSINLYLDVLLQSHVEILLEDILYTVKLTKAQNPIGGTFVWFKNSHNYLDQGHQNQEVISEDLASKYLQGDIYTEYMEQPEMPDANFTQYCEQTQAPICVEPKMENPEQQSE